MASAPTLHAFDPQIVGKIGLRIDAPGTVDQVDWYVATRPGGPYFSAGYNSVQAGLSGLDTILSVTDSVTRYWVAKVHDSTGYSGLSNEVSTVASAGPPPPPAPPTPEQQVSAALGITLQAGDIIDVYPATPTTSMTVNADGSIS